MATTDVSSIPDLRYPIGRYSPPEVISADIRQQWISELKFFPNTLREAVAGLDDTQLNTPYRPGGWTVRQLVHHLADSHMNSYTRFRLALTEDSPLITPYDEKAWAELYDARQAPVSLSLDLIESLHARWTVLLSNLGDTEFARTFQHPERGKMRLDWTLGLYSWHGRHHIAHIAGLKARNGW